MNKGTFIEEYNTELGHISIAGYKRSKYGNIQVDFLASRLRFYNFLVVQQWYDELVEAHPEYFGKNAWFVAGSSILMTLQMVRWDKVKDILDDLRILLACRELYTVIEDEHSCNVEQGKETLVDSPDDIVNLDILKDKENSVNCYKPKPK